jgi:hypothetical protein
MNPPAQNTAELAKQFAQRVKGFALDQGVPLIEDSPDQVGVEVVRTPGPRCFVGIF